MHRHPELVGLTPEEILLYLRKSQTDDPLMTVEEVLSRHEKDLDEYTEKYLGGRVPEHNRFREVVSGETIEKRDEFLKVLRKIESPKVRAILVKECSRLGRPDLEEIGRISKLFRFTNTLIITPQRVFDLRDEWDREAFEREMMRSNDYLNFVKKVLRAGRERSVADGCYLGSIPPYGFDKTILVEGKTKYPTLKENKEQADVVRMVFDLYVNHNMTPYKIGKHLMELGFKPLKAKRWVSTTLIEMLTNVHYIGRVRWNMRKHVSIVENGEIRKTRPLTKDDYVEYEGRHEGIISEELFFAARDKLGRTPRVKPGVKVRNPFAGILFCRCGKSMLYKHPQKAYSPRLNCPDQPYCDCGSCYFDEIVNRVSQTLAECIENFEIRLNDSESDSAKLHEQMIRNLEKKLSDLDAKELAQWEAQSNPDETMRMPAAIFKKLNEKLQEEREQVKQALKKAYETMPEPVDYEKKIYMFKDALEALNDPEVDAATKNALLKSCIDRIEYFRERPQIRQITDGKFPLKESAWTNPPIELDIKLRV